MLKIAVTACLCFAPVAALAKPVTYECLLNGSNARGWVSETARYVVDEEAGTATAYDGLIHFRDKKPRKVSLSQKPDGRYILTWKVKDAPAVWKLRGPGSNYYWPGREITDSPTYRVVLTENGEVTKIKVSVQLESKSRVRARGRCKVSR